MLGRHRTKTPDTKLLAELLDRQAEALLQGENNEQELVEEYPELAESAGELFRLARRVSRTLQPVEPSAQFVRELGVRLSLEEVAPASRRWERWRKRLNRRPNVVGTIVSIVAIIALIVRLVGSVIMIIAFILSRRRSAATI